MTLFMRRILLCATILMLWSGVSAAQSVGDTTPSTLAGEWSVAVDGVRGRLLRTWYADNGAMQLRIDLELEHVAQVSSTIEMLWTRTSTMLDLAAQDSTGTTLPRIRPGGNEFSPLPYMLALPAGGTVQIPISARAIERVADGGALLRPLTFQAWDIATPTLSDVYLSGVFRIREVPSANRNAWQGSLQLPPVALGAAGRPAQRSGEALERAMERDRWEPEEVDALFYSEPRDEAWASRNERRLAAHLAEIGLVESTEIEVEIECRTTACRIDVIPRDERQQFRVLESLSRIQTEFFLDPNDGLRPLGIDLMLENAPRYPLIVHFLVRDESSER